MCVSVRLSVLRVWLSVLRVCFSEVECITYVFE